MVSAEEAGESEQPHVPRFDPDEEAVSSLVPPTALVPACLSIL